VAALILSAGKYHSEILKCGLTDVISTRDPAVPRAMGARPFPTTERSPSINRRNVLNVSATTALGLVLSLGSVAAQQKTLKEQLVGTWTLVSNENERADGSKVDVFGANPKGLLIFDGTGHYSLTIMRSDLPKFAASTADQGTAQENKAVLAGMVTHFGTYSTNETDKTIITHVEASSFPNIVGIDQKRLVASITADELRYTNPATVTGTKAQAVRKRVK
jgi:hypothetical protein